MNNYSLYHISDANPKNNRRYIKINGTRYTVEYADKPRDIA